VATKWKHHIDISLVAMWVSFGEQLINDINRLKRHFPAVPIKLILIAPDDE
jgi:hypothetical protein